MKVGDDVWWWENNPLSRTAYIGRIMSITPHGFARVIARPTAKKGFGLKEINIERLKPFDSITPDVHRKAVGK